MPSSLNLCDAECHILQTCEISHVPQWLRNKQQANLDLRHLLLTFILTSHCSCHFRVHTSTSLKESHETLPSESQVGLGVSGWHRLLYIYIYHISVCVCVGCMAQGSHIYGEFGLRFAAPRDGKDSITSKTCLKAEPVSNVWNYIILYCIISHYIILYYIILYYIILHYIILWYSLLLCHIVT
jgi:hypothetical protein